MASGSSSAIRAGAAFVELFTRDTKLQQGLARARRMLTGFGSYMTTAGAAIRYTLDGTYPAASNAAAVLYTVPIEITAACTLLAVAEAADHLASNLLRASIAVA